MSVIHHLPAVAPPACRSPAMFGRNRTRLSAAFAGIMLSLCLAVPSAQAQSTDIANVPMAVTSMVTPNVLIMLDNSQSMDAQMGGALISGNNADTRGNIGRTVMRKAITDFRNSFNWGLMSYQMSSNPPGVVSTYNFFLGSSAGMVFTADCTGFVDGVFNGAPAKPGVSADGGGRCIANPQWVSGDPAGLKFLTFNYSSDDPNIVDALYYTGYVNPPAFNQMWTPATDTAASTSYTAYRDRASPTSTTWINPTDFGGDVAFSARFTPTDAGFLPSNSGASLPNNISRSIFRPRGWGYNSNVTGNGALNRSVQVDSTAHYNALQALLANETSTNSGEIKNGAKFTTLKGTVDTARSYFSGTLAGNTTPVGQTCQKNFVMMVTDGLPTGTTGGALYSDAARTHTCTWDTTTNTCTSGAFGAAATELITSVSALRTTTVPGLASTDKDGTGAVTGKYDVQTYVVALGETVANAQALSVMNALGNAGGTGAALPANDATAFSNAITKISDDITAKVGASAAVAVANGYVTSLDNASFATSYNSGTWTGDIDSFAIDVTTGIPSTISLWSGGSARTQLDARTAANRFLATSVDPAVARTGGRQFQSSTATGGTVVTTLSAAQQTLLNSPSATDGASVLAYLRGDRSGETAGTYRPRVHLLGDMINGEPVLVRAPSAGYADAGYSDFASSNASRTRMLFQGANDGMLHAFVASTGAESWAYVPNLLMGSLNNLSSKTAFTHQYYVDGTPVAGDVDFKNVAGGSGSVDWRTILVGGLGKGGRGYFALDITSPVAASEADLASKVLWEFPSSITDLTARNAAKLNMGFSYGKPIIVKTNAKGWVVLVTSGYNNGTNNGTNAGDSGGDGMGHVYVINPKTGDLLKDIVTTGCTGTPASNPCGLAHLSAYVANGVDNTAEYVYGGDLKGNVWRFDFTGNSVASWSVAKFAELKDAGGATQPITTAPELALVGAQRMVYVGTGLYLGPTDIPGSTGANASSSQTQSMYGLKDVLTSTLPTPLRSTLQQQTFTTTGTTRTATNNTVNYSTQNGWYIDFPTTGERVNTDPTIAVGALIFTTNIPSGVVCQPGGSSWEYFINLKTGGPVDYSTDRYSPGVFLGNALASRPVLIQLPSAKVVSLVRSSDAKTIEKDVPVAPPGGIKRRISWRELFK